MISIRVMLVSFGNINLIQFNVYLWYVLSKIAMKLDSFQAPKSLTLLWQRIYKAQIKVD
jgi:hypothetical protein